MLTILFSSIGWALFLLGWALILHAVQGVWRSLTRPAPRRPVKTRRAKRHDQYARVRKVMRDQAIVFPDEPSADEWVDLAAFPDRRPDEADTVTLSALTTIETRKATRAPQKVSSRQNPKTTQGPGA